MLIHQDQCVLFYAEVAVRRCSVKKVFLKLSRNSQESICVGVSFSITLQACFIKKKTPKQVFSREFCKIFKNTFLYRTPAMAASANGKLFNWFSLQMHWFLHDGSFGFKWFKGLWEEALAIEKNKISVKNYWNLLGKLLWLKLGF